MMSSCLFALICIGMRVASPPRMFSRLLLAPIALVFLAACGGALDEHDPSAAASPPPSDGAGAPPEAPRRRGTIELDTFIADGTGAVSVYGRAEFGPAVKTVPSPTTPGCALVVEEPPSSSSGASEPPTYDSAGPITLDLDVEEAPVPLFFEWNPRAKTYFDVRFTAETAPRGTAHVRAPGDVVPAFEASLALMAIPTFTAPAPGTPIGDADLELAWTVDDGASIWMTVSIGDRTIVCNPPSGTSMIVPRALLQEARSRSKPLPQADAPPAEAWILGLRGATTAVGTYDLRLTHVAARRISLQLTP